MILLLLIQIVSKCIQSLSIGLFIDLASVIYILQFDYNLIHRRIRGNIQTKQVHLCVATFRTGKKLTVNNALGTKRLLGRCVDKT